MEFHLYDKVRVTKDVVFENRVVHGIVIKKGTIIDISKSIFDENKYGYTLELYDYAELDPTFTFTEDCLELVK